MNSKTIAKDSTEEVSILRLELERKQKEIKILEDKMNTNEEVARRNESLLHSLVEAAAGKIGQDFFDNIVLRLSEWLGAECVLIGRMVENERIKAVPLYLDGKISQDFSYDLAGSPCDITTRKGYCEFDKDVINLFPKDKILVDLNAEGYIGTALYNKEGVANGVICAVSRKKLIIPSYAKDILKIIGARVSAEIERLKTEEDLKQSEAELKESNATKDKFFSIIAHDLKSPFNLILGFSELLTKNAGKYDAEKQKKMIEAIHQATRNAHALLENLLTWALTQRKLITYNPEVISLEQLVAESVSLPDSVAEEKNITVSCEVPHDITVWADKQMLSTVIRNLVSNAIKFTPSGGSVGISARLSEGEKNKTAEVNIIDSGVGMEQEVVSKLFHIDEHHSERGTADEKGTGLGLIICKDFVERNGGTIHAESQPGKGSKFIFTLKVV